MLHEYDHLVVAADEVYDSDCVRDLRCVRLLQLSTLLVATFVDLTEQ